MSLLEIDSSKVMATSSAPSRNLNRQPSAAYLESQKIESQKIPQGQANDILDEEYKKYVLPEEKSHRPHELSVCEKITQIGLYTVLLSLCLISFGIAVIITSLVLVDYKGSAFILFMIVGFCAFIPGTYAVYTVLAKCFGWKGFERALVLPS